MIQREDAVVDSLCNMKLIVLFFSVFIHTFQNTVKQSVVNKEAGKKK